MQNTFQELWWFLSILQKKKKIFISSETEKNPSVINFIIVAQRDDRKLPWYHNLIHKIEKIQSSIAFIKLKCIIALTIPREDNLNDQ